MKTKNFEKLSLELFNDSKITAESLRHVYGGLMCSKTTTGGVTRDCSTSGGGHHHDCDAEPDIIVSNDPCDGSGESLVHVGDVVPVPEFEGGTGIVQAIEYCGGECQ